MDDLKSISNEERISVMMDGELSQEECGRVLGDIVADRRAIETWHVYQVVGDVMRSPELAPARDELKFLERLEKRLAQEPKLPQSVPTADLNAGVSDSAWAATVGSAKQSANAPVFRWKMLVGVACSAVVAVVGGGLWNQSEGGRGDEFSKTNQIQTQAPLVVAAETPVGPMLRDSRLDELMAAHRQLGGHSALQVPAGFLRNATYEGAGR